DATRPYRRQIALRSQPASPVPSRLAKKDRFSEQNTSKTLKNRRLWTGTRLIELCQRGVRNKDSLREMLRAAA
ncbi:hypothetical protein GOC49_15875, partial [Sinorhizobium meliloti]|nr:hypothetical protein [Sinorhizobium meliloti]